MRLAKWGILCTLFLLVSRSVLDAQSSEMGFPTIISNEIFAYDDVVIFSNDVRYYQETHSHNRVVDTLLDRVVFFDYEPYWTYAGWSPDNSKLAFFKWGAPCASPSDEANLFVFHMQDESTTQYCLPFDESNISIIQWSPFQDDRLAFVGPNQIFTLSDEVLTPFEFALEIDAEELENFVGYSRLLWDPLTQLPAAKIYVDKEHDFDAHSAGLTTQSTFIACTQQCVPILDTLSVANVDVNAWQLYDHWLLWEGFWPDTGLPTLVRRNSDIADTSVFLTNIKTGTTEELFRFSSLGLNELRATGLSWSPDATTVALDLGSSAPLDISGPLPTSVPGVNHSLFHGTLLLHLNWPPTADAGPDQIPTELDINGEESALPTGV